MDFLETSEHLARQINYRLLKSSSASIFKVLQFCSKLVKMFSACQFMMSALRVNVIGGLKNFLRPLTERTSVFQKASKLFDIFCDVNRLFPDSSIVDKLLLP